MKIFFKQGHKNGDVYTLSPPGISFGRELDNDIILSQAGASRYHSKLIWKNGEWYIRDLGSTNGTYLNGEKIEPEKDIKLKNGDIIRIGTQTMCFAEKPEDVPEIPPADKSDDASEPDIGHSERTLEQTEASEKSKVQNEKKKVIPTQASALGDMVFDDSLFKAKEEEEKQKEKQTRKHAGILFYASVIAVAVLFVAGYLILDNLSEPVHVNASDHVKKKTGVPFLLLYEKETSTNEGKPNIFRFVMEIKDNKVTITRDDLQAGLRDSPSREISDEQIKRLKEEIKESGFMNLKQGQLGSASESGNSKQTLTVAFGREFNSITVRNMSPPRSFDDAVQVLEDFSATELNVPAISLTPEERRKEGIDAFRRGKMLYDNYKAERSNLYKSINLFKIAIENLGAFSPEPPEYRAACELKDTASRILREQLGAHQRNANSFMRLKQYDSAVQEWREILDKTEPGSKNHKIARKKIIQLEELIRQMGK